MPLFHSVVQTDPKAVLPKLRDLRSRQGRALFWESEHCQEAAFCQNNTLERDNILVVSMITSVYTVYEA